MTATILQEILLWQENISRAKVSENDIRSQYTQVELDAQGDGSQLYRYTLRNGIRVFTHGEITLEHSFPGSIKDYVAG